MAVRRRFLLVVAVLTAGAAILAQAPAQLQVDGAEAGVHVAGDQTFTGRGHSVRTPLRLKASGIAEKTSVPISRGGASRYIIAWVHFGRDRGTHHK